MASVSAWANDYKNDQYISRELTGYTNKGDILIFYQLAGKLKQKQSMNLINYQR